LDAGKGSSPSCQLSTDDAQVDDVEWIFDGVVDAWFEDFTWIDEAGFVVITGSGYGGESMWSTLFEVVTCREAEALADGRATEMCVAGCESGGKCVEGGLFNWCEFVLGVGGGGRITVGSLDLLLFGSGRHLVVYCLLFV